MIPCDPRTRESLRLEDTVTVVAQDTPIEVKNGGRKVSFTGRLLSRVTSERAHAPRWTTMELYRTTRGLYVVHRVGVSKVYHTPDCELAQVNRLPYGHELPDGQPSKEKLQNMASCSECRPSITDPASDLRFERERHWSGIAETPEAAIDMLHRNDNGQRSLPWIAANLLNEAAIHDRELANAYETERI